MNKLINAIPEERILEELDYILRETINTFVENEKYRIPVLNEFKKEIDLMAKLIGERTMILMISIQNMIRVINAFEDDRDNFDCRIFVNGEIETINFKKYAKFNRDNISMIMTREEFEELL